MTDLDGKVALVTGAASGIGEAITARLRAAGATVVTVDLRDADVAADLTTRDGNREAVDAALSSPRAPRRRRAQRRLAARRAGRGVPRGPLGALLGLLLTSAVPARPLRLAGAAVRRRRAHRRGRLRARPGGVARTRRPTWRPSTACSAWSRRSRWRARTDGITAAAVCPGFVRTPLVEAQIADQARAHGVEEDRVLEDVILAPHVVKRLIEPCEVADAVAFLPHARRAYDHGRAADHGPGLDRTLNKERPVSIKSCLLRGGCRRPRVARPRALQHRRRRLRQAPARQARDDPRALRRRRSAS